MTCTPRKYYSHDQIMKNKMGVALAGIWERYIQGLGGET